MERLRERGAEGKKIHLLEITLISAQGLNGSSVKCNRMQTYALAWVDSSVKLRTCIDRVGGENPTWNDRFLFKVSPEFLASETSGVTIEIYSVGILRDTLLGTVRFLVSNFHPSVSAFTAEKTPSFLAVQVRRPSGRFQGVLNIGATVLKATDVPAMNSVSAVGFHDLIAKRSLKKSDSSLSLSRENLSPDSDDQLDGDKSRGSGIMKKSKSTLPISRENLSPCSGDQLDGDNSKGKSMKKSKSTVPLSRNNLSVDSVEQLDVDDSTNSPSSPAASALRDWNGMVQELERTKHIRASSDSGRMFCGLGLSPRKVACLTPFMFSQSFKEEKVEKRRSKLA